jgi:hypothetical protein
MSELGGYPGTRLDLSELQGSMIFLGKRWTPEAGQDAMIQITRERIETFRCAVEDTVGIAE